MIKGIIFDLSGVLTPLEATRGEESDFVQENVTLVRKLNERYKTAILSNASANFLQALKESGFYGFFNFVALAGETGIMKPDREAFELVLEELNLQSEEVVVVDDSLENIEAAKFLGMKTVHYKNPTQLKERLASLGLDVF